MKTDNQYQPKTGAKCSCRPGVQRDNCPSCEGTGQVIDFAEIRARKSTPEPERLTIRQFCEREEISMARLVHVDSNPNMQDGVDMDHWHCTLGIKTPNGKRTMRTHFSMGRGHNGKAPTVDDVLSCAASDAAVKDMSFQDFCSELGYDTDSRKAEATYKACVKATEKLRKFIGLDRGSVFEELVYDTERL